MDKIDSREKHLNNDLKGLILEYKDLSIELSKANNEIKDKEREKSELEDELGKLTNDLENVKAQMEQRGNSMTDGRYFCKYLFVKTILTLILCS